jgi:hypothetical protein
MRPFEKLVSFMALSVIVGGATYAYNRERLADADLHSWYQQTNTKCFHGELPDVAVRWGNLQSEEALGETRQYQDGSLEIVLDRYSVTTETKAHEVLFHEACHVAVGVDHDHDEKFQECMTWFE